MTGSKVRIEASRASLYARTPQQEKVHDVVAAVASNESSNKWTLLKSVSQAGSTFIKQPKGSAEGILTAEQSVFMNDLPSPKDYTGSFYEGQGKSPAAIEVKQNQTAGDRATFNVGQALLGPKRTLSYGPEKTESRQETPERNFALKLSAQQKVDKPSAQKSPKKGLSLTQVPTVQIRASPASPDEVVNIQDSYRMVIQTEVEEMVRNRQNRVTHPSALGLLTSQAMMSGGVLTRKGVCVRKSTRTALAPLAEKDTRRRNSTSKRTLAPRKSSSSSRNGSSLNESISNKSSQRAYQVDGGDVRHKPVTSLKRLTTGKAIEQLKQASKRHHQTSLASQYATKLGRSSQIKAYRPRPAHLNSGPGNQFSPIPDYHTITEISSPTRSPTKVDIVVTPINGSPTKIGSRSSKLDLLNKTQMSQGHIIASELLKGSSDLLDMTETAQHEDLESAYKSHASKHSSQGTLNKRLLDSQKIKVVQQMAMTAVRRESRQSSNSQRSGSLYKEKKARLSFPIASELYPGEGEIHCNRDLAEGDQILNELQQVSLAFAQNHAKRFGSEPGIDQTSLKDAELEKGGTFDAAVLASNGVSIESSELENGQSLQPRQKFGQETQKSVPVSPTATAKKRRKLNKTPQSLQFASATRRKKRESQVAIKQKNSPDTKIEYSSQYKGSQLGDSPRSSVKKRVLSLYAGKVRQSEDEQQPSPLDDSKTALEAKLPLSKRYASLIANARHEVQKQASNLEMAQFGHYSAFQSNFGRIKEAAKQSPLDGLRKSLALQELPVQETPPLSREIINQMYQVPLGNVEQGTSTPNPQGNIRQVAFDHQRASQVKRYQLERSSEDKQSKEASMLSKLRKMEKAKHLLKAQARWNHNTKNERLSSKKRREQSQEGRALAIFKQQSSAQLPKDTSQGRNTSRSIFKTATHKSVLLQIESIRELSNASLSPYRLPETGELYNLKKIAAQKGTRNLYQSTQLAPINHNRSLQRISPNETRSKRKVVLPKLDFNSVSVTPMAQSQPPILSQTAQKSKRFAKVPLLSDPHVSSPQESQRGLINPSEIFRGKTKRQVQKSADFDAPFDAQVSLAAQARHQKNSSILLQRQRARLGKLADSCMSVRASIQNVTTPIMSKKSTATGLKARSQWNQHSLSQSMSLPQHTLRQSSQMSVVEELGYFGNAQKLVKNANFRDKKERLRNLIKRNVIAELHKSHHTHPVKQVTKEDGKGVPIKTKSHKQAASDKDATKSSAAPNKSGEGGVDSPCSDDRCGYCSSDAKDSIFNGETNRLSNLGDENTLSNSIYKLQNQTHLTSFQPGPESQKNSKSHKQAASSEDEKVASASETDLLNIKTKQLSKRPSKPPVEKTSLIQLAGCQTDDDEIERHSIAIDMRTMQEMHDSMGGEDVWQNNLNVATLSKNYTTPRVLSPSVHKQRQTHSTLFNQYNLPDYMLQSPPRLKAKKNSNGSNFGAGIASSKYRSSFRKETPNLDLAHIDENVSRGKVSRKQINLGSPLGIFKYGKARLGANMSNITSKKSVTPFDKPAIATYGDFESRVIPRLLQLERIDSSNQQDSEAPASSRGQVPPRLQTNYDKPLLALDDIVHEQTTNHQVPLNEKFVDKEALVRITTEKARAARAMVAEATHENQTNQLQPSRSGYFGPGTAVSAQQSSSQSPMLVQTQARPEGSQRDDNETPLQKLINSAVNQRIENEMTIVQQSRPPQITVPNSFVEMIRMGNKDFGMLSNDESEEDMLKAKYRGPPRNQIGRTIQDAKDSITGGGAQSLLKEKGIHVGGGGMISRSSIPKDPRRPESPQNIGTAYLPGYGLNTGINFSANESPLKAAANRGAVNLAHEPVESFTNSILDANLQIYKKTAPSKASTIQQRKSRLADQDSSSPLKNQNIDLVELCLSNRHQSSSVNGSSMQAPSQRAHVFDRSEVPLASMRHASASKLSAQPKPSSFQGGGAIRITGYGVKSIQHLSKQQSVSRKPPQEPALPVNDYAPKVPRQSPTQGTKTSQLYRQTGKDMGVNENEYSRHKDSLYITLTGRESASDDVIPTGIFEQPSVTEIKVNGQLGTPESTLPKNISYKKFPKVTQVSPKLASSPQEANKLIREKGKVSIGQDASCGVSLQSSVEYLLPQDAGESLDDLISSPPMVVHLANISGLQGSPMHDPRSGKTTPGIPNASKLDSHRYDNRNLKQLSNYQLMSESLQAAHHSGSAFNLNKMGTSGHQNSQPFVHTKRFGYGTIELGEGDTASLHRKSQSIYREDHELNRRSPTIYSGKVPDLSIKGTSVAELQHHQYSGSPSHKESPKHNIQEAAANSARIEISLAAESPFVRQHHKLNHRDHFQAAPEQILIPPLQVAPLQQNRSHESLVNMHQMEEPINFSNLMHQAPSQAQLVDSSDVQIYSNIMKMHQYTSYQASKPLIQRLDSQSTILEKDEAVSQCSPMRLPSVPLLQDPQQQEVQNSGSGDLTSMGGSALTPALPLVLGSLLKEADEVSIGEVEASDMGYLPSNHSLRADSANHKSESKDGDQSDTGAQKSKFDRKISQEENTVQTQRIYVPLESHQKQANTVLDNSIDMQEARHVLNMSALSSEVEGRHYNISLHDRADEVKNLKVKQTVREMHQLDGVRRIDTTNRMEMYNSTIMKIVVTQKKASCQSPHCSCGQHQSRGVNTDSRLEEQLPDPSSPVASSSPFRSNAIFGSSVLINGVAMQGTNQSYNEASPDNSLRKNTRQQMRPVGATTGKKPTMTQSRSRPQALNGLNSVQHQSPRNQGVFKLDAQYTAERAALQGTVRRSQHFMGALGGEPVIKQYNFDTSALTIVRNPVVTQHNNTMSSTSIAGPGYEVSSKKPSPRYYNK